MIFKLLPYNAQLKLAFLRPKLVRLQMQNCKMSIQQVIIIAKGGIKLKTHEDLVKELASLSSEELKNVLDRLEKRLEKDKQLKMSEEIIKKYKPALEELAK